MPKRLARTERRKEKIALDWLGLEPDDTLELVGDPACLRRGNRFLHGTLDILADVALRDFDLLFQR
jgi:hypothetical protein